MTEQLLTLAVKCPRTVAPLEGDLAAHFLEDSSQDGTQPPVWVSDNITVIIQVIKSLSVPFFCVILSQGKSPVPP